MNKSRLIKYFAVGAIGLSSSLSFNLPATVAGEKPDKVDWGYVGEAAPDKWGELSAEFQVCQIGNSQSPINLESAISAELGEVTVNYKDAPLKIVNNGHTIQVNYEPGSSMIVDGKEFKLLQFHFHHPSEHEVDDNSYPMEVHLVHSDDDNNLAVLGVLIEEGEANSALQPVFDAMPTEAGSEQEIAGVMVNAAEFLPSGTDSYRYFGSLTTPPCSEQVRWMVLKEPIQVSAAQIAVFRQAVPMNARPVQALNMRFLLQSR